jgi:carbamoyl-phosphate synthase large subunit
VFFSLKNDDKEDAVGLAERLVAMGFTVIATKGTAEFLRSRGVPAKVINKVREGSPHIVDELQARRISLVVNTPEGTGPMLDSRSIRLVSLEQNIPLFTTVAAAEAAIRSIEELQDQGALEVCSIQEYVASIQG